MNKIAADKKTLGKFGLTMAVSCALLALLFILRGGTVPLPLFSLILLFLGTGLLFPAGLRLAYLLWMRLVFLLGWINTRMLLLIIFYLILTPIAMVLKIMRKDLLERKIEREKTSYWIERRSVTFDPSSYERQF
jgi:hypothetical protein